MKVVRKRPGDLSPFDYWLEYLAIAERWEEMWAETYDAAVSNWQLEICWRLLREARRLAVSSSQQALVRYQEGRLHAQSGAWQRAATCYELAMAGATPADSELRLSLLGEMGMLHRLRGNHRNALSLHRRQYELAKTVDEVWYQAEALEHVSLDYEALNRLEDARENLELALQLWQRLEAENGVASTYKNLGLVTWQQRNLEAAEAYLRRARQMMSAGGQPYDLAQIEGNLGNVAYERDQWDVAEAHYVKALSLFDKLGVVFDRIGILNNLAGLAVARHAYEQAHTLYQESLALAQMLEYRQGELDALLNLSVVALWQQRWSEIPALYAQALGVARRLNNRGAAWNIRRRQLRFVVLYGLLRLLSWIRDRLGPTSTKEMEVK